MGHSRQGHLTANGVTRSVTTSFDGAGLATTVAVTGGVGEPVPDMTSAYDPASGRPIKTVSPTGGTITRKYDKLGRETSYTDADGGSTTSEFDILDRKVKVSDNTPSTDTYTYDRTVEPRGMATKTRDSVAGEFRATYDADGSLTSEKLPGGYTLQVTAHAGWSGQRYGYDVIGRPDLRRRHRRPGLHQAELCVRPGCQPHVPDGSGWHS